MASKRDMGLLFKATCAFAAAAWFLGTGPFSAPPAPRWQAVRAELASARPQERLAAQAQALFRPGTPHPAVER